MTKISLFPCFLAALAIHICTATYLRTTGRSLQTKPKPKAQIFVNMDLVTAKGKTSSFLVSVRGGDKIDLAAAGSTHLTMVGNLANHTIFRGIVPTVKFEYGTITTMDKVSPYTLVAGTKTSGPYLPAAFLSKTGNKTIIITTYKPGKPLKMLTKEKLRFEVIDTRKSSLPMVDISKQATIKELFLVQAGVPKNDSILTEIKGGETINLAVLLNSTNPKKVSALLSNLSLYAHFAGSEIADDVSFNFLQVNQTKINDGKHSDDVSRFESLSGLATPGIKLVSIAATKVMNGTNYLLASSMYNFTLITGLPTGVCPKENSCKGPKRMKSYSGFTMSLTTKVKGGKLKCKNVCVRLYQAPSYMRKGYKCGACLSKTQ